nr:putative ribonuclease H-like domain-containing protein [Tanacetum cinerariifolium]
MMSPDGSIIASLKNINGFLAVNTPPDDLIRTDFKQEGIVPKVLLHIFEEFVILLGRHPFNNKVPRMEENPSEKSWLGVLFVKKKVSTIQIVSAASIVVNTVSSKLVLLPIAPTTAEQSLAKKNELKAQRTLLMDLQDKHRLKFNIYKDAKSLMEAIKKRLQKLISQLEILSESLSQEDINLKSSSSTSSTTQNITFVSSQNTDNINESVSAIASVSAASTKVLVSALPNVDNLSDVFIYSFFASQSNSLQLDNDDLKQIDANNLEEMDLKCVMVLVAMIGAFRQMKNQQTMPSWHSPPQVLPVLIMSSESNVSMPTSPVHDRKKMVQKPVRNHAIRGNHQHYARMTHPHPHRLPDENHVLLRIPERTICTMASNIEPLFCRMNGIKRKFSVARTPQQNGITERKNMTLIKAARTMIADLLLPIPFWAEAVNTACYEAESVQKYVLLPLWSSGSKDPQNTDAVAFDVNEPESTVHVSPSRVRDLSDDFEEFSDNRTNGVNTASTPVTAVGPNSTNNINTFSAAGPSNNAVSLNFELGGKYSYVDPS